MSQVTVRELWESGQYRQLKTLKYSEIVDFVFRNIRYNNCATKSYFAYNISTLLVLVTIAVYAVSAELLSFKEILRYFIRGLLAGSFLVIPVHEIIHGISYLLLGAPKIFFGADLRQMIFYVSSDKFVIGRRKFYKVALSPFVVINLTILALFFMFSLKMAVFFLSFLFFHNIMCIGDFAMVSYYVRHKDRELYTYDDHKEKTSYIFEKLDAENTRENDSDIEQ